MSVLSRVLLAIVALAASPFAQAQEAREAPLEADAQSAVLLAARVPVKEMRFGHVGELLVGIVEVDGEKVGTGFMGATPLSAVRLTPGEHRIRLVFGKETPFAPGHYRIVAEPGKTYRVHLEVKSYDVMLRSIVDDATGEIAGRVDDGRDPEAPALPIDPKTLPAPIPDQATLVVLDYPKREMIRYPAKFMLHVVPKMRSVRSATFASTYVLPPGLSRLEMQYLVDGDLFLVPMAFEFQPGHVYALRRHLAGFNVHYTLEDAGKTVAEVDSGPPRLELPPMWTPKYVPLDQLPAEEAAK
jgi:hypothetical protein